MNAKLVYTASGAQREVELKGPVTTLGRRRDCDVCIPAAMVSRQHCQIIQKGDLLIARDLGSANGTRVNDTAVAEQVLHSGDRLQIGPVTFLVQYETAATVPEEPGTMDAMPLDGITLDGEAVAATPVDGEAVEAIPVDGEPVAATPVDGEAVEAIPVDGEPVAATPVDGEAVEAIAVDGEPVEVEAEPVEVDAIPLDAGAPEQGESDDADAPIPLAGSNIFDDEGDIRADALLDQEGRPTQVEGAKGRRAEQGAPDAAEQAPADPTPQPQEAEEPVKADARPVDATPLADDGPAPSDVSAEDAPDQSDDEQDRELAEFLSRMSADEDEAPAIEPLFDEDESPPKDPSGRT